MTTSRWVAFGVASGALLAGGMWLADFILQPIPMPLGGAAVFGWLGFWIGIRRRPVRGLLIGFVLGAVVGVIGHVRSHIVEDRVEGLGPLALHALADLGVSLLGAALILAASVGWIRALNRNRRGLQS